MMRGNVTAQQMRFIQRARLKKEQEERNAYVARWQAEDEAERNRIARKKRIIGALSLLCLLIAFAALVWGLW